MLISVKHVSCHVLLILYFYCLKKIEIKQTIIYWLCTASLKPCRVQKRMKISKKKMNVPSTKNKVVGLPIQNSAWCKKAADSSQPNGKTALNQKVLSPVQIAQKIFDYETASNPSSISAKERERGEEKRHWRCRSFCGNFREEAITTAIFGFKGLGMGRKIDKVIAAIAERMWTQNMSSLLPL